MGDQEREIEGFLGKIQEWQKGRARPFASIFWPGQAIASRVRPTELDRFGFHKIFQPTVSSYHFNITQDRICSGGPDTLDEFWYQSSSYNMTNWALWYNSMLDFFNQYNLNDVSQLTQTCNTSVVSAAAHTWTVPSTETWKIKAIVLSNATRAFRPDLSIQNGGAGADLHLINLVTWAAGTFCNCIGGGTGAANTSNTGWDLKDMIVPPDTVIILTDTQFVAADNMEHTIYYEVVG